MVLFNLSRQLLKHLSSKLNSVVVVLSELDELDEISLGFVALEISHLAIVIVELMHGAPVFIVTDTDYDHTQWKLAAFYKEVLYVFLIVDDSIS